MIKNKDLYERHASENPCAPVFDLVGKILASAAKRIQEQDPDAPKKTEERKSKGLKLNITWKN